MVYKKYIKRGGKTYGPYYYESYREKGKVKTRFVSGPKKKDKIKDKISRVTPKKAYSIFFFSLFIVTLILFSIQGNINYTGFSINEQNIDKNQIEIIEAYYLDENRSPIKDIYNIVSKKDNKWANINNNEFVRVKFEQPLTNKNDITLFARSFDGLTGKIEVYPKNSDFLITVFENILIEDWYKVFLNKLNKPTDVFDLKVLGNLEIDYVVDPTAPNQSWNVSFDSLAIDNGNGIAVYNNSAVYIVGNSASLFYIIKYNASNGSIIFNFSAGNIDAASAVVVDNSENIYVTGYNASNYVTISYNSSGDYIWNVSATSSESLNAYGIAVDNNDGVYVTGKGSSGSDYFYTIKYNISSNGDHVWNSTFDSMGNEVAYGIAADNNDSIYVTGIFNNKFHTIKYNASNGSEIWNASHSAGAGGAYEAHAIDLDSSGNIYVTGDNSSDYFTISYDSSGNHRWNSTYTGTNPSHTYGIAYYNDSVFVTGTTNSNYYTIRYNATNGSQIWNKTDVGGVSSAIDIDSDGNIYITGNTSSMFMYTIKYGNATAAASDTTPPNLTINQPTAITYTTATVNFNATALDETGMDSCWYSLDSGATNTTITNSSTSPTQWTGSNSTMAETTHTVTFYCNDTSNNINNSETLAFTVDLPSISSGGGGSSTPKTSLPIIIPKEKCSPKWDCDEWSECSVDGSQTRDCKQIKICLDNPGSPPKEERFCTPKIIKIEEPPEMRCGDWSECRANYKIGDLFEEKISIKGSQSRVCIDPNNEESDTTQTRECSTRKKIKILKIERCGEEVLEIYDDITESDQFNLEAETNEDIDFFIPNSAITGNVIGDLENSFSDDLSLSNPDLNNPLNNPQIQTNQQTKKDIIPKDPVLVIQPTFIDDDLILDLDLSISKNDYCSYCYNGVQDSIEDGVDCSYNGNSISEDSCPICETQTTYCGNKICEEGEYELICPPCTSDSRNCECTKKTTCDIDCTDTLNKCGDNKCDLYEGENELSCPQDCQASKCGNGVCDPSESIFSCIPFQLGTNLECYQSSSCPQDCEINLNKCGNNNCEPGEELTCPQDCQVSFCGNYICEPGEMNFIDLSSPTLAGSIFEKGTSCPQDCSIVLIQCPNGFCEKGENILNCPYDCSLDTYTCGDSICDDGETRITCPLDCDPFFEHCGNGICEFSIDEDITTCPQDCNPLNTCGNNICDASEIEYTCPPCAFGSSSCECIKSTTCEEDCGFTLNTCGDGFCDASIGETILTCPSDCKQDIRCEKCGYSCVLTNSEIALGCPLSTESQNFECQLVNSQCNKIIDIETNCGNGECEPGEDLICPISSSKIISSSCILGTCPQDCQDNVECYSDEDCGTDQFIESRYCASDGNGNENVYQNFLKNYCVFPGEQRSYCLDEPEGILVQDCDNDRESCLFGNCVNTCLFGDCKECNDNDNDEYDNCEPDTKGDDGRQKDCNDNDPSINPGSSDNQCNGIDNNCNTIPDDEYISTKSTCGLGQCTSKGILECINGQEINSCTPKQGSIDTCNGIDDNCDGQVDEFNGLCVNDEICTNGECIVNQCTSNSDCPNSEITTTCNNNAICTSSISYSCIKNKCIQLYSSGVCLLCEFGCTNNQCNENPPKPQCSDGIDNDGDKLIDSRDPGCWIDDYYDPNDNDESNIVIIGECSSSEGCLDQEIGTKYCDDNNIYQEIQQMICLNPGTFQSQCSEGRTQAILIEQCDDQRETCIAGTCINICLFGDCAQCNDFDNDGFDDCVIGYNGDDGREQDCNDNDQTIYPGASEFQCNGIDNDCDSKIDEDYVEKQISCGVGECLATGRTVCGSGEIFKECQPLQPSDEICDLKDNDCDGNIDEGDNLCLGGQICSYGSCLTDQCTSDSQCKGGGIEYSCKGDFQCPQSYAYICQNNKCTKIFSERACNLCTFGCNPNTNQCIEGEIECSENSDCGESGFTGSKTCGEGINGDVYQNYQKFTCLNPGTTQSSCQETNTWEIVQYCSLQHSCILGNCIDFCFFGDCAQCVDEDNDGYDNCEIGDAGDDGLALDCNDNDQTINPGASDNQCDGIDNDCNGKVDDGYVGSMTSCGVGECKSTGILQCISGKETDSCFPKDPSLETDVCDNLDNDCDGLIDEDNGDCPLGELCTDGECKAVSCNVNSDCGANGFIGDKVCQSNNLYQNFKSFTCLNPGTASSSCTSDTELELVEECEFGCVDGASQCNFIIEVTECSDGVDNDEDGLIDSLDPGCWDDQTSSSTYNSNLDDEGRDDFNIICNKNLDCGESGFTGSKTCEEGMEGDVYQNYREFTCLNPGMVNSECKETNELQIATYCTDQDICLFGSCIDICFFGNCNECEDNDKDGFDNCKIGDTNDDGKELDCNDEDNKINPGAEDNQCDGLDNDCDSKVDEAYQNTDTICGVGECSSIGSLQCIAGEETDSCSPKNPNTETCDNKDNDCDGTIDENNGNCPTGELCTDGECKVVTCNANSDCGSNDYIGDKVCQSNNLFQNFKSLTCLEAGTIDSSCTSSTQLQLAEECENGCLPGTSSCIIITSSTECSDNIDNDRDSLKDEQDPGCWDDQTNSTTYNKDLNDESYLSTCIKNTDCGKSGFTGDKTCDEGNAKQNYQKFTCLKPATKDSECLEENNLEVVLYCTDQESCIINTCIPTCLGGDCKKCKDKDNDGYDNCRIGKKGDDGKQLDCKDNDDSINPGQVDDQCDNKDNDCDGAVDEAYKDSETSCGIGECLASGLLQCLSGKEKDSCTPGQPSIETCDNKDNDCDNMVDEDNGNCPLGELCTTDGCKIVNCNSNSDCGTDEFAGDKFCKDNNLYQNHNTYICQENEDSDNSCTSFTESREVEACQFGCNNNKCNLEFEALECHDKKDNDGDNSIDKDDPGCWNDQSDSETYNSQLDNESRVVTTPSGGGGGGGGGSGGSSSIFDREPVEKISETEISSDLIKSIDSEKKEVKTKQKNYNLLWLLPLLLIIIIAYSNSKKIKRFIKKHFKFLKKSNKKKK